MNALGRHALVELWNAKGLDRAELGEEALAECVKAVGATLLDTRFVRFPNGGYSGVCILAESHVTIHTWPEHGYAAVDIFSCGPRMDIAAGLEVLKRYFEPGHVQVVEVRRGIVA